MRRWANGPAVAPQSGREWRRWSDLSGALKAEFPQNDSSDIRKRRSPRNENRPLPRLVANLAFDGKCRRRQFEKADPR
jgi:hypothetical protein